MILGIADVVSAVEYKQNQREAQGWGIVYDTYSYHICDQYFSVFVKMAMNPSVVRKYKIDNTIDPKGVKIALTMHKSLLDQLQLWCATSSVHTLFAKPPSLFAMFAQLCQSNSKSSPLDKKIKKFSR